MQDMNGLACLYTNADSLLNKRSELMAVISSAKPDIVAVTEIYPKVEVKIDKAELEIDGYDCFISGLTGRGVCIYLSKSLNAKLVEDLTISDFEENVWCEVRLQGEDRLLIGCVYRSPNSTDINNKKLWDLINDVCGRTFSHLLVVGDFNHPEIDWESWTSSAGDNHESSLFLDCLQDNYLHQITNFDTRYRIGQRSSLLDLVITNDDTLISNLTSGSPLGKSDHVTLFFTMDCSIEADQTDKERFLYNKGAYDSLRKDLSNIVWDEELCNLDVNESWIFFENKLKNAMDNHIPKTKPNRCEKEQKKFKPLWMCKDTMQKVKKKYNAWKRYTRTKDYQHYVDYTHARNEATKVVRKAKRLYESKLAKETKDNPKAFWKYI
ncbi:uncharacterized protein [Amphiura filiformis]|uniref:uncharacterized protein n=1 Tax=Amphiura filiformis TaxID=82378 RepID=UPI003B212387